MSLDQNSSLNRTRNSELAGNTSTNSPIKTTSLKNLRLNDSISSVKFVCGTGDTHLVVSSWDGYVYIVNAERDWTKCKTKEKGPIMGCVATDMTKVYFGGLDNSFYYTEFSADGSVVEDKAIGCHEDAIRCVEYSSEKDLVISGSWDCSVKLWDCKSNKDVGTLQQTEQVFGMKVRDDILVVATRNRKVLAWDLRNMAAPLINRPTEMANYQSRCVDIFPDKNRFVIGNVEGRICIESIIPPKTPSKYAFRAHVSDDEGHPVNVVRVMDGTPYLASGASDGKVKIWDVETKKMYKAWEYNDEIAALDYSSLHDALAIGSSYLHDREQHPTPIPPSQIFIRKLSKDDSVRSTSQRSSMK